MAKSKKKAKKKGKSKAAEAKQARKSDKKSNKKSKKVPFQPESSPTVTANVIVHDGRAALAFYKDVLGAKEIARYDMGDKVAHAELKVGDSVIALADEAPDFGALSPKTVGGTPVILQVYVKDCDKAIEKALAKGATATRPIENQFWGDRSGQIKDPFGHLWTLATCKEVLTTKQIKKRMAKLFG